MIQKPHVQHICSFPDSDSFEAASITAMPEIQRKQGQISIKMKLTYLASLKQ